jgi:hypothetical protein
MLVKCSIAAERPSVPGPTKKTFECKIGRGHAEKLAPRSRDRDRRLRNLLKHRNHTRGRWYGRDPDASSARFASLIACVTCCIIARPSVAVSIASVPSSIVTSSSAASWAYSPTALSGTHGSLYGLTLLQMTLSSFGCATALAAHFQEKVNHFPAESGSRKAELSPR